jgi:predicted nucleotidyltransferase
MFDIAPYRQELARLCQRYGVEELALFGSALREDFNAESDIDFVVKFSPKEPVEYARAYFGFIEALEELFGRRIDLLSLRAVRNPYLKANIESTKKTLYAAQG